MDLNIEERPVCPRFSGFSPASSRGGQIIPVRRSAH